MCSNQTFTPGRISHVDNVWLLWGCLECVAVVCKSSAECKFETRHVWGLACMLKHSGYTVSWYELVCPLTEGDKRLRVSNVHMSKHFALWSADYLQCCVYCSQLPWGSRDWCPLEIQRPKKLFRWIQGHQVRFGSIWAKKSLCTPVCTCRIYLIGVIMSFLTKV